MQCEVYFCERKVESGVCDKCVEHAINGGSVNYCNGCDQVVCDNCGLKPMDIVVGGEGSPFFCCDDCFGDVKAMTPSELDFQMPMPQEKCCNCEPIND